MIGTAPRNAKMPKIWISLTIVAAADAPAKYVIDVHRKLSFHICRIGFFARRATQIATIPELRMYWVIPITQIAATQSASNDDWANSVIGPKINRRHQTVPNVDKTKTATLKENVSFVFETLYDETTESMAASRMPAS